VITTVLTSSYGNDNQEIEKEIKEIFQEIATNQILEK